MLAKYFTNTDIDRSWFMECPKINKLIITKTGDGVAPDIIRKMLQIELKWVLRVGQMNNLIDSALDAYAKL